MLTVMAPGGSQLPVQNQSTGTTETLQRGSDVYTGVAKLPSAEVREVLRVGIRLGRRVDHSGPDVPVHLRCVAALAGGRTDRGHMPGGRLIGVIVSHRRNPGRPVGGFRPSAGA